MMKISKSLRDIHSSQSEQYEQLQERVDSIINAFKDRRWHYESRVKDLESFALKVETGRYDDPNQVEDFFACTLVVENLDSMSKAETLVSKKFKFHKRRPKRNDFTSKPSDSFRFDDTRLYVSWKDDPAIRPTGLRAYFSRRLSDQKGPLEGPRIMCTCPTEIGSKWAPL